MMKIAIGVLLVFAAVWGILDATGVVAPFDSVVGDITVFQLIVGVLMAAWVVQRLSKLKIPSAIFLLSILFMVFERNVAYVCGLPDADIINNWILLLMMTMLCIGLALLLPKKTKFGDMLSKHRMGSNTVYIDASTLAYRRIENNLGSTVVRFENTELYEGGGELYIENNKGAVTVLFPSAWTVDVMLENNLGHVSNDGEQKGNGPLLRVTGENNMGAVNLKRI